MNTKEVPSGTDDPVAAATPILSLPELPPLSAEHRRLRQEGVHIHRVCFDRAAAERERLACIAALARLSNARARLWYFQACTINDWYEGRHEVSLQDLCADLDRAGEFPGWKDFERETLAKPLADLHAHADFRVLYQVRRHGSKIVAVRFHVERVKPAARQA